MMFKQIKEMHVSAVGFGCWAIGGTWNNVADDELETEEAQQQLIHQNEDLLS